MRPIRRYFTLSNALAAAALFIALGGSAYAVSAQSVGTKELKRGAVTPAKIRNGAVTGPKIRAGAVGPAKIRRGAVRSVKIAPGAINRSKLDLDRLGVLPAAERAATAQQAETALTAESAQKAESADTATSADHADKATEAAILADRKTFTYRMALGMTRNLAENGDVSVRARCIQIAGESASQIYAHTKSDGAVLLSTRSSLPGGSDASGFLNRDTPEGQRDMELTSGQDPFVQQSGSGLVMGQDAKGLMFASGDLAIGVNQGGVDCFVGGVINLIG